MKNKNLFNLVLFAITIKAIKKNKHEQKSYKEQIQKFDHTVNTELIVCLKSLSGELRIGYIVQFSGL